MPANSTSLYSYTTSNANVSSSNFTSLYQPGSGAVKPQIPYGDANVVFLLENGTVAGNTVANIVADGLITATGNIVTSAYFIGDGSQLSNISAGNIVGAYGNANVVNLLANFGSNAISTTGNVTAGYFFGNGSQLTGLPATYSNAQVAAYLASGTVTSNIITSGNVSGTYIIGDGSALTNITGANVVGSVANATYANSSGLAVYVTGNTQANITSVGTLTSLSVSGNTTVSNVNSSGTISTSGNIDAQGTISATGNIVTAGYFVGNFAGNITGNITVPGSNTQVLFNTNGNADAVGGFTYDKGSNTMTVLGVVSAQGNVIAGNVSTTGIYTGNGSGLTSITGANVVGNVADAVHAYFADTANAVAGANVTGNVGNAVHAYFADVANSVSGANVSGAVANAVYADSSGLAVYVTGNAQANITSVGTLTGLNSSGNISAAGNITGNYFIGNGSQLTGLPAGYSNADVSNYLASGTNTANIITTGNISGNYILGNGSQLTGLPATYSNANVSSFLAAFGSNSISTTGNITAGYFAGDGSQLSNINAGNIIGSYGNSNVAGYLASGNVTSNIITTANVSAAYVVGNGSALTSITGANVTGSVANAVYADTAGLAAYVTGNAQANITSVGTLTSLSVSGNVDAGNLRTTGIVSATGGLTTADGITATGNISTSGNIIGAYLWGDGSNITGVVAGSKSVRIEVKNTSGGTLAKGTPVYATGTVGASTIVEVSASRADTPTTMPALGLLESSLAINGQGYAISVGTLTTTDTSTYTTGQELYVAATGGLTASRPTNANVVQTLGIVGRVDASNGSIEVNIWNINSLPNLGSGNIWIGNAAAFPTQTTLATYTGNIGAGNISVSGNVVAGYFVGDGSYLSNINAGNITGAYGNSNVSDYLASGTNTANIITTGNVSGTYIIGNGSALTNLPAANIVGNVANATLAEYVTNNAQANITSVGTLTSLSVSGNTTSGNLLTAGLVSATGNVTGNWVIGTSALQAARTSVLGNIVAAPGNITIARTFGSDGIYAPDGSSASVMANGQVIMGYGYNGNVNANAISTNSQGQGTRFLFWDYVQRANTAAQGRQITAARVTELTANVTNANFREIALAGHMQVGGGSAGYSASTTTPFFFNGLNGRLQFGNDGSGGPNVGNIVSSHGTAMVATIATYGGSNVGNSLALLLNNQSFSTSNVTNMIGLGFFGTQTAANTVANWYGIAHTGSNSTFGFSIPNSTRAQTTNYYYLYNTDDLAQNQMGPLRSYQEVNYTSGTSGTVDVNKQNGQVQTIALAGNVTIGSFTNFVTTATVTANAVTKTTQQTDTVTLIIKQGATPYTVTMPTGNAAIKYAGNVSAVGATANAVTMVSITGANISGTVTYMVTVSPEFV